MSELTFDFMGKRKIAAVLSIIAIVLSVASLAYKQLAFGLDFTGGTLIEVGYKVPADLVSIREQLSNAGYESPMVQNFGSETDVLVRLAQGYTPEVGEQVLSTLSGNGQYEVELRRSEFVGSQVGEELREQGGLGMLFALGAVMLYVALRFQLKFSLGAVVALGHDVIIVLGLFSWFQWNFDLTVLAAIMAVIGYSLNDTIVVFDRIRENFRLMRKGTSFEIINTSLNQTLGRTLITSLTTLIVLVALFVFGGELIRGFAVALTVGVLVGTYSSIYVASNILLALGICKEDLMPPVKEGSELDEIP
jgi:preprotein translocase subunit SecF